MINGKLFDYHLTPSNYISLLWSHSSLLVGGCHTVRCSGPRSHCASSKHRERAWKPALCLIPWNHIFDFSLCPACVPDLSLSLDTCLTPNRRGSWQSWQRASRSWTWNFSQHWWARTKSTVPETTPVTRCHYFLFTIILLIVPAWRGSGPEEGLD